jgi:hypothetical protein
VAHVDGHDRHKTRSGDLCHASIVTSISPSTTS